MERTETTKSVVSRQLTESRKLLQDAGYQCGMVQEDGEWRIDDTFDTTHTLIQAAIISVNNALKEVELA